MEDLLIRYAETLSQANFSLWNINFGKGGPHAVNAEFHYVYLALAKRYARITET